MAPPPPPSGLFSCCLLLLLLLLLTLLQVAQVAQAAIPFAMYPGHGRTERSNLMPKLQRYEVVEVQSKHFPTLTHVQLNDYDENEVPDLEAEHLDTYEYVESHKLAHPDRSEFQMSAFGKEFSVQLNKNKNLFAPDYWEERQVYDEQGNRQKHLEPAKKFVSNDENCHYQGRIADSDKPSLVALSTCFGGFDGLIQAHSDSFAIKPALEHLSEQDIKEHLTILQAQGRRRIAPGALHIVYRMEDIDEGPFACGVKDDDHQVVNVDTPFHPLAEDTEGHQHDHDHDHAEHDHVHDIKKVLRALPDNVRVRLPGGPFENGDEAVQSLFEEDVDEEDSVVGFGSKKSTQAQSGARNRKQRDAKLKKKRKRSRRRRRAARRRRLLQTTKKVELLIVNDNKRFTDNGAQTEILSAGIVNVVASMYAATSFDPLINIVLTKQVTFLTNDPYSITLGDCTTSGVTCASDEVDVQVLLPRFNSWRSGVGNAPDHDNAQLFSGYDFSQTTLGFAGVGVMCIHAFSGGIDQTTSTKEFDAAIVAHEMGHNFGMFHDSTNGNPCPQSGFIMNAVVSRSVVPTAFSSCSRDYLQQFITPSVTCLNNEPTEQWGDPVCGNGFREEGESCDCGQADCSGTADPCCNGTACQLFPGNSCSNNLACCSNCQLISNQVCRAATTTCDLAEVCDGINGACPPDDYKGAGQTCSAAAFGDGACFSGYCNSHSRQCRELGASFPGAPYDQCPDSSQVSLNGGGVDARCKTMYCSNSPAGCTAFTSGGQRVLMPNGVPCGASLMCFEAKCVPAAQLNTNFEWVATPWSICETCNVDQTRNITCRKSGVLFDAVYCSPPPPITFRKCGNITLGCVHNAEISASDVSIFGFVIAKNTLMFGSLGASSLFFVVLACCYQAVTYGHHDSQEAIAVRKAYHDRMLERQQHKAAEFAGKDVGGDDGAFQANPIHAR